ncbi:MAG: PilZ domain-containing protein [Candidatus Omnitrophica bacterium]|nr:PilZ domain-containing protein [Candidatus Omnitrophota bacterium]MDD5736747.1 PilZ domain-containing protein [Candidatus Omnitrophota bacterium]
MSIDSRAGIRVKIDATIMVEIDMGMKDKVRIIREPQKAVIVDISIIGLGVISPIFLPKGAILVIQLDTSIFGPVKPARVIGEVRYCRPSKNRDYRTGVKFIDIDKALLAKIKEYVEQHKNSAV